MNPDQVLEREWLQQIAGGDRSAFERFYQRYRRRVFGYLFRITDRADTAEELTTDVMLEVWKGARRFRGESRVSTWVFGIARFKALSSMRRTHVEWAEFEEATRISDQGDLPDEMLMKGDLRDAMRAALGKLSRAHREVMELTYYEGFSSEEVAEILACPRNTVKTRMFHARKHLRKLLEDGVKS